MICRDNLQGCSRRNNYENRRARPAYIARLQPIGEQARPAYIASK